MQTSTLIAKVDNRIIPRWNWMIVERDSSPGVSPGGILLLPSSIEAACSGVVLEVGDGRVLDTGERVAIPFAVGQRVIFSPWASSQRLEYLGKKDCYLVRDTDVYGVIA